MVYNPDDFRQVYVYEGDDLPLVTLTHEHVRKETPAWTFREIKARFDSAKEEEPDSEAKAQFLLDLDNAVTGNGKTPKTKSRSKREENKETVRRAKDQSAVQRSIDRPLTSAPPFGIASPTNPSSPSQHFEAATVSYDDAPVMTIVNRTTGEKLL